MNCILPGSYVHGILQARILERVAIPFSGDLPDPESEPASLRSPVLAGWFFTAGTTWQAQEAFVSIETKHLSLTKLQNFDFICLSLEY